MTVDSLRMIYFSPTGTTKRILEAIAEGIKLPIRENIDITRVIPETKKLNSNILTLIGVPVYSGRVSKQAIERLSQLKADNTPTVVVVVYGNRAYEDALLEIKNEVTSLGFDPCFGAAFIGEHSWNSDDHPIANGRPDKDDLQKAKEFGESIGVKINNQIKENNKGTLIVPGNLKYKERKVLPKMAPLVEHDVCNLCGSCEDVCPVAAIEIGDKVTMNEDKCILCSACVKQCPQEAISFKDPWLLNVIDWLATDFNGRKEPEFFY